MGRPRQTKVDAIKFIAHRDNETKQFDSWRAANAYVSEARRSSRVQPTYWKCRYWVLEVDRVPRRGEDEFDESSWSGYRLSEREVVTKGSDPEALKARAEALRRASFEPHWVLFTGKDNLGQLAPNSRQLALECVERFYGKIDHESDQKQAKREHEKAEAAKKAALDSIPTVAALVEAQIQKKLLDGRIQTNTADVYRYEAAAFEVETTTASGRQALGSTKVHEVSRDSIDEWFGLYAARPTRLGKLPTAKTCENVLSHLRGVGKALRRREDLADFASRFDIVEPLLEDVKASKGKGDGWRNRRRLTNDSVEKLIAACQSDLERAALALSLAGSRPPSEPTAVQWDHLDLDTNGNLWWHVQASAIEHVGGTLELRSHTKTKEVDYRQLSIAKRFVPWIEALRGRSELYILGHGSDPMLPKDFTALIESLIERAKIGGTGISTYSLRHTVSDEVERILGRSVRDLVLHGRRDRSTGSTHYSHAQRDRRRAELTHDGKPYSEQLVWAKVPAKQ